MKQEKGQRQFVENPREEEPYSSYEIRAENQQTVKKPKERRLMIVAIILVAIVLIMLISSISAMCTVEDKLVETNVATRREMAVVATTTAEKKAQKTETTVATESMESTVSTTVATNTAVTTANTTVTTVETTLPEAVVTDGLVKEPVIEETPKPQAAVLSAYGPSENYYYNISAEDKLLMAKLVWREAGTECFEGQVAVAAVVLNRYFYGADQDFERESIADVIFQPHQFANISNITMEDLEKIPSCIDAVDAACKGWDPTREAFPETGAMYFYAPKKVTGYEKEIREEIKVMVIGNHNFHADFQKVN